MSSSTSSSSLFTPLQFTGISQYSSDFQSIINRAVSIASLPLQALSNHKTDIDKEETLLSSLGTAVSSVATSIQSLSKLGTNKALSASTTDSTVVTATATGATAATSYSISEVTSIASSASETTTTGYADSNTTTVSTSGTLQLVYGSQNYTLNLTSAQNNLVGVRDAINALGAGVTASILTTASGNYLSISANSPGATTMQLNDNGATPPNILTSLNQGTNTNFKLNGIAISEPSTTINDVIPGLTLTISGKTSSGETVGVKLATDRSQITSALQTLVSNYNTLADQVNAQIGSNAGLLTGNNIVYQIRNAMSQLVQYQGSGSMSNLANLGIEIGSDGHMSLNQDTLTGLSDSEISQVFTLFGSDTTGIGALQKTFTTISDPVTGAIKAQQDQWTAVDQRIADQMSAMTDKIAAMQQSLNKRLQAADASLAQLQSQQSLLTSSIDSLNYTTYGKNFGSGNSS
jgi:flagellar hook-associated protein 2